MTLYEALKEVAQSGRMAEAGEEASAGESAGKKPPGRTVLAARIGAATVPEDMEPEQNFPKRQILSYNVLIITVI